MRERLEVRQMLIFILTMSFEVVYLLSSLSALVLSYELIEVHLKMEVWEYNLWNVVHQAWR